MRIKSSIVVCDKSRGKKGERRGGGGVYLPLALALAPAFV